MSENHCPCGSNKPYEKCCGLFIEGKKFPKTPEALMRSRYTAFTKGDIDYIDKTMREEAARDFDKPATKQWIDQCQFMKLTVLNSSQKGNLGTVEFIAEYLQGKHQCKIHEISQFKRDAGKWYYVDGEQQQENIEQHHATKIGRNDPCPCGSGQKYKKCCGKS